MNPPPICANYRFSQDTIHNVKLLDKWMHLFRGLRAQDKIATCSDCWLLHRSYAGTCAQQQGRREQWLHQEGAASPDQDQVQKQGSGQTHPARLQGRGRSEGKPENQTSESQSGSDRHTRHSCSCSVAQARASSTISV